MSIEKHPDYKKELQHLKNTKYYIDSLINSITKRQAESKSDIKEAFEILDFLDSSQSYITILVNARYLDHSKETIDKVLGNQAPLAKPVVRHGNKPKVQDLTSQKQVASKVKDEISRLLNKNYASIAIIGKTLKECKEIEEMLAKEGVTDISLVTGLEEEYHAGVVVVPSYAAKGLEFDGVIIVNLNESYRDNELDTKLLYVSITRAMHNLSIYYMKNSITHLDHQRKLNQIATQK